MFCCMMSFHDMCRTFLDCSTLRCSGQLPVPLWNTVTTTPLSLSFTRNEQKQLWCKDIIFKRSIDDIAFKVWKEMCWPHLTTFDIQPQDSAVLTSTSKFSHRHLYSLYTVLLWCIVSLLITSITDVFILDQIKCSVVHRDILPHAHCTWRTETTLYYSEQLFPNIKGTFCCWYFLQLGALTCPECIIFYEEDIFCFFLWCPPGALPQLPVIYRLPWWTD